MISIFLDPCKKVLPELPLPQKKKMTGNWEFNKIISTLSRRRKTNDEAVLTEGIQEREQNTEAIIGICESERFNENFTIRRKTEAIP